MLGELITEVLGKRKSGRVLATCPVLKIEVSFEDDGIRNSTHCLPRGSPAGADTV
jgi:hypothetical protein